MDRVGHDLALDGLVEARVVATAVRLLDLGFFRIGGEDYARQHETFGIASLQRRHVRVRGGRMVFDCRAKEPIRRQVEVADDEALEVVKALKRRRGGEANLFAYKDGSGWSYVRSSDINGYICQATGGAHSAKDFRTWAATVPAAAELAAQGHGKRRELVNMPPILPAEQPFPLRLALYHVIFGPLLAKVRMSCGHLPTEGET